MSDLWQRLRTIDEDHGLPVTLVEWLREAADRGEELERQRDELLAALNESAKWFREYEAHHALSGKPVKARNNADKAKLCEAAIAKAGAKG